MEKMVRPRSLREVAEITLAGGDFGFAVGEFLDETRRMGVESVAAAVEDEPALLPEDWKNAWLAGAAEHMCRMAGMDWPEWTEKPERFLKRAWFDNGGLESLKAMLLVESPLAFRRRMVFTERRPLRRV